MSETNDSNATAETTSWRDKSLKAAGYGYIVGDMAMMAAGAARGRGLLGTVSGGAAWLAGGVAAARYGNPDIEKQLAIQASKLEAHLKKNGVTIPDDARAQSLLLSNKTVWGHVQQFMYEHPSELLNGMYAVGAAMLLHEGITKDFAKEAKTIVPHGVNAAAFKNVSSTFWMGAIVSAGALLGLFVKEDRHARERLDADASWMERAIAYVKEQPLRASAGLYTVNNGFLGLRAYQDFSERHTTFSAQGLKPHFASTLQLAAYLYSNAMLYASSRNQITRKGFTQADMAKLEHAAALVIAGQAPQTQQALLADVSAFMATQQGVTLPADKIAADLATRVTALTHERMQLAAANVKSFTLSETNRRDAADATPTLA